MDLHTWMQLQPTLQNIQPRPQHPAAAESDEMFTESQLRHMWHWQGPSASEGAQVAALRRDLTSFSSHTSSVLTSLQVDCPTSSGSAAPGNFKGVMPCTLIEI